MVVNGERRIFERQHPHDSLFGLRAVFLDQALDQNVNVIHQFRTLILPEMGADQTIEFGEGGIVDSVEASLAIVIPVGEASLDECDLGGERYIEGKFPSKRPVEFDKLMRQRSIEDKTPTSVCESSLGQGSSTPSCLQTQHFRILGVILQPYHLRHLEVLRIRRRDR